MLLGLIGGKRGGLRKAGKRKGMQERASWEEVHMWGGRGEEVGLPLRFAYMVAAGVGLSSEARFEG